MKSRYSRLILFCIFCFAILAAAMTMALPVAYAFTIDSKSNTNSDGSPKFTDPDEKVEQFGNGTGPTQQGNGTFQFGVRPLNGLNQQDGLFGPPGLRTPPR
jgi:hypothetical protein